MNKTEIKKLVVRSHKFVTANAEDFESWEWENTVLDNLYVWLMKAWKKDWKAYFFLKGFKEYLNGCVSLIALYGEHSQDYRKGLSAASELIDELKYFGEAFGCDSYELTI